MKMTKARTDLALRKIPKLYSNCLLVKGYKNHIICDVQLQKYIQVPADFIEVILNENNETLQELRSRLSDVAFSNVSTVVQYLHSKGYLDYFDVEDIDRFPALSVSWEMNSLISNAIVDFGNDSNLPWKKLFSELAFLGCEHIQLRNFNKYSFDQIVEILKYSEEFTFASFSLIIPFKENINGFIRQLTSEYKAIRELIIYSSLEDKIVLKGNCQIVFVSNSLTKSHCGNISKSYFSININTYTEAQKFNTCLNRKVGIDELGNISNCPSMPEKYGNIFDNSLFEIIQDSKFKKYWSITKDNVLKCMDCEYRYICTDCRAYLDDPSNVYSAPLKCGYNPYKGIWEEWSTNPLKKEILDYYTIN